MTDQRIRADHRKKKIQPDPMTSRKEYVDFLVREFPKSAFRFTSLRWFELHKDSATK